MFDCTRIATAASMLSTHADVVQEDWQTCLDRDADTAVVAGRSAPLGRISYPTDWVLRQSFDCRALAEKQHGCLPEDW